MIGADSGIFVSDAGGGGGAVITRRGAEGVSVGGAVPPPPLGFDGDCGGADPPS